MFNRTLRVDVVKKDRASSDDGDRPESSFDENAATVAKIIDETIKKITVTMVVYIALDTVRKVAVASVSR